MNIYLLCALLVTQHIEDKYIRQKIPVEGIMLKDDNDMYLGDFSDNIKHYHVENSEVYSKYLVHKKFCIVINKRRNVD